jgi:catechol 2,3-dioxygenase-like lactoylglutathione lyase family enzyme
MPRTVHHLAIKVADLDRAEQFYTTVVELPVVRRWNDEQGRPRSVWLALGNEGAFIALERADRLVPVRADDAPGLHCVVVSMALGEREEVRSRLLRAGIAIERESAFTMYARDPDGNIIGWSHYPES